VNLDQLNAGQDHVSRIETGDEPTSLEEGLVECVALSCMCHRRSLC